MNRDFGKLGKRKIVIYSIILLLVVSIISGGIYYFSYYNKKNSSLANGNVGTRLANPAEGLSLEEAIAKFDEKFVYFLLVSIKAYNLHNPLFSNDIPKMNIYVDDDVYSAKVIDGNIKVSKGNIEDEDIAIRTTKEEAVKMINDKNYVRQSFQEGKSGIELISSKLELYSKGYLDIYDEFSR